MKIVLGLILFLSPVVFAADKQPTVIVVPQSTQAQVQHHNSDPSNVSIAVIAQQIQDLATAESRRDSVEQMLISGLSDKVNGDGVRIDRLESEAATIMTVGGLALTLLLAFAGWSVSVSSDRHKENRATNQQIATAIQALSTAVAVIESKMGITLDHK
jgi:hypothetical protein